MWLSFVISLNFNISGVGIFRSLMLKVEKSGAHLDQTPCPCMGCHDLASPPDFCSFYNILKTCRGHTLERSVFSERTEESSAVQYFQVGTWRLGQPAALAGSWRLRGIWVPVLALPLAQ